MKEEWKRTTHFTFVRRLGEKIKSCSTRGEIGLALKNYWNLSENKVARTTTDDKANSKHVSERFCSSDRNLVDAIEMAERCPYIYDALKNRLLEMLKDNSAIKDVHRKALIKILGSARPKNKRTTTSSSYHTTLQLAACAWIVMQTKPDNIKISLTSPDTANLNSIYALVANATSTNPEAVKDALKKHPAFSIKGVSKNKTKK